MDSVDLPAVLHPYLGGKTRIAADGTLVCRSKDDKGRPSVRRGAGVRHLAFLTQNFQGYDPAHFRCGLSGIRSSRLAMPSACGR